MAESTYTDTRTDAEREADRARVRRAEERYRAAMAAWQQDAFGDWWA